MKKILCLLLAGAMCLGLLAGCGSTAETTAAEETAAPEVTAEPAAEETAAPEETAEAEAPAETIEEPINLGDAFPNFTVTLEDGSVFTLSEALQTHKIVMINIWATWCHFCVAEMPAMQQAYAAYSDDVALVCLSCSDTNEEISAFKEANDLQLLPMGADTVGLYSVLAASGLPTTVIIDKNGNMAFSHSGYYTDPLKFTRLWDFYLSDDYTDTVTMENVPVPQYEGEYPTDEELTAALCTDGSVSFTYEHDNLDVWPFMPDGDGAVNSNALTIDATASFTATVTAQAGDVFAFDYDADIDTISESMDIQINGEDATPVYYTDKATWVHQFDEAGEYKIDFSYTETLSESATDAAGTIRLSNFRLASGDAAQAILDAQPTYTTTLTGTDFELEMLNDNAKKINITGVEGMELSDLFGSEVTCYILEEDTCSFRMLLGDGLDFPRVMAMAQTDGREYFPVATMESDGEGYPFEVTLSCVEDGGNPYNAVAMYGDAFTTNADGNTAMISAIILFRSEENVNSFLEMIYSDDDGNLREGVGWSYADGTEASATKAAEFAKEETFLYNIYLVDEDNNPVNGCMINICSDSNCCPQMLKDTNFYGFNGINDKEYAYQVHVLKVPDGYTFDTTQGFTLKAEGDTLIITVPKA